MLQFIMDQNVLLYVLAAACAAGVVSQIILKQIYEKLIKDTRNTGEPDGRFLQQLRQRFQYCTHLNEKVGDVQALIQKSLMEYRFWGMSLHQWKRLGMQCLTVSLLCAFAGATALIWHNSGDIASGSLYFWTGAGAIALMAAAYGIADTKYRRESLVVGLTDYLENSGAVRDYSEAAELESTYHTGAEHVTSIGSMTEGRKARKRAKAETAAAAQTRAQKEKNDLKENLARMKAGMQETAAADRGRSEKERNADILRQMDPAEQERILREVLKEFLS